MPPKRQRTEDEASKNTLSPDADAAAGLVQIELAENGMSALVKVGERFAKEKPFKGLKIAVNLHVTKETAVLIRALAKGGAKIALTGCNAFSTQDNIAAALASEGIEVHAIHGCSKGSPYTRLASWLTVADVPAAG